MFKTKCPNCGGQLYLSEAKVTRVRGVAICEDGFDLFEANRIDTEDEQVICAECGWEGLLETE